MIPREQINRYLDSYGDRDKIVGLIVNPSDFHEFHRTGHATLTGLRPLRWDFRGHSYQVEADHRCPEGGFWVVLQAETRETPETRELQANAQEGNDRPSIFEPLVGDGFPDPMEEWYFRRVRCADGPVRTERFRGPPTFTTGGIARDALLARPAPAPPVTSPAVEEDRGW